MPDPPLTRSSRSRVAGTASSSSFSSSSGPSACRGLDAYCSPRVQDSVGLPIGAADHTTSSSSDHAASALGAEPSSLPPALCGTQLQDASVMGAYAPAQARRPASLPGAGAFHSASEGAAPPALRPISSGSMQQPLPAALMSQMSVAAAPVQQTAESLTAANTQLREQIQQQLSTASVSARSSPSMVASIASRVRVRWSPVPRLARGGDWMRIRHLRSSPLPPRRSNRLSRRPRV